MTGPRPAEFKTLRFSACPASLDEIFVISDNKNALHDNYSENRAPHSWLGRWSKKENCICRTGADGIFVFHHKECPGPALVKMYNKRRR